MGLRDILKKKSHLESAESDPATVSRLAAPEFTFVRSDTYTQEVIHPPSDNSSTAGDDASRLGTAKERDGGGGGGGSGGGGRHARLSLDVFRGSRSRSASASSGGGPAAAAQEGGGASAASIQSSPSTRRRLSHRLHLHRRPPSSDIVPQDLPEIVAYAPDGREDKEGTESQWEKRATILARENERHRHSRPPSPVSGAGGAGAAGGASWEGGGAVPPPPPLPSSSSSSLPLPAVVSSKAVDEDIQEAIRLHEEGQLEKSTALFRRLADPQGANNPLSQVLYGLALRHGWGCQPDPEAAVDYLSAAASNAAAVENLALQAGLKKGGAAKGELVLAIFELANCFRHGWGIPKDPVAAKQYYETAANLGDTDAMNEVAWCYLEGFGTKKDKYAAAKYYRLAEQNGNKTLGNSWIWKEKYDPENSKTKKK